MKNPPSGLADLLAAADLSTCAMVTGFDGFVDEMISVVGERQSLDAFTAVPDIATFGGLVTAAAGQSSLREIVVQAVHPGGCAVNMADGLASLGVPVSCFATLGRPVHPAFGEIAAKCKSFHSWGDEPGRTLAFEFSDGKLMFSAVRQLADFTPESVSAHLADGAYARACADARVIALTDWTLYPHMNRVWELLQHEVYAGLRHRPHFLVDLVDPSGRSPADVRAMAALLRGFEPAGPLTLGLNGNEANILSQLHGLPVISAGAEPEATAEQADALRQHLGLTRVVIHRIRYAVAAEAGYRIMQAGPYCARPRKSTGAGDRFNAGLAVGLALGCTTQEALALGCATSGFFVRNAESANRDRLVGFLRTWTEGRIHEPV